jgi:hypothetical protein
MAGIKVQTIDIVFDGKTVQVKNPEKGSFELNKALHDPVEFKKFVIDPKIFVKNYGLEIDGTISAKLSEMIGGYDSLEQLKNVSADLTNAATGWAVAAGSYSIATSKIAVAF